MQIHNQDVVQQNVERYVMTMNVWNVKIEKQNIAKQLQKNDDAKLIIVNDTKKIENDLFCDDKTSH